MTVRQTDGLPYLNMTQIITLINNHTLGGDNGSTTADVHM